MKKTNMYLRKCGLMAIALTLCLLASTVRTGVKATDPDLVLTEDQTNADAALTETNESDSGAAEETDESAELAEDVVVVSEEDGSVTDEVSDDTDETVIEDMTSEAEITVINEDETDVLSDVDADIVSDETLIISAELTEAETPSTEVVEDTTEYSVHIYDQGYLTLEDAINAAEDGDTITLDSDITASSTIYLNKSITVDFNGHTLNSYLSGWDNWSLAVRKDVTVTLKNGTINAYNTMLLTMGNIYLSNMTVNSTGEAWCAIGIYYCASLNLSSDSVINAVEIGIHANSLNYVYGSNTPDVRLNIYGQIHAGTYAIKGNTTDRSGTTINIYSGSTITSDTTAAIYNPQPNSSLNIYGGTISGTTGIEMGGGTLYVDPYSDAVISGTSAFALTGEDYNTSLNGAAIVVAQVSTYYPVSVSIYSGTFNGYYALYESNLHNIENLSTSIYVEGGTFLGSYCAAYVDDLVDGSYVATIVGGAFSTDPIVYVPADIPVSYFEDLYYVNLELYGEVLTEEDATPEEPVDPEEPTEPEIPDEETEPETPVDPEEPAEPEAPEEETEPDTPEDPEEPEIPEEPEEPEVPEEPEDTEEPEIPEEPEDVEEPEVPEEPEEVIEEETEEIDPEEPAEEEAVEPEEPVVYTYEEYTEPETFEEVTSIETYVDGATITIYGDAVEVLPQTSDESDLLTALVVCATTLTLLAVVLIYREKKNL